MEAEGEAAALSADVEDPERRQEWVLVKESGEMRRRSRGDLREDAGEGSWLLAPAWSWLCALSSMLLLLRHMLRCWDPPSIRDWGF